MPTASNPRYAVEPTAAAAFAVRTRRTFPRIVLRAGNARASLRCSPDAEDVTPCDNRVAPYTVRDTACQ